MKSQILSPTKETLEFRGNLSYGESVRAWNTIRFKKDFIGRFSMLKEKTSKFSYSTVLYTDYDELEKALKKMKREKLPLPMLLMLEKVKAYQLATERGEF